MSGKKISAKEISEQIAQKTGVNLPEVENFLDNFQQVFMQAIEQDKLLKISKLGTFKLIWNKPHKSIDAKGAEIEVAGYYRLNFNADNALEELLNSDKASEMEEAAEMQTPAAKPQPLIKLKQQAAEIQDILVDIQQNQNTPVILSGSGKNFENNETINDRKEEKPEPKTVREILQEKIEEIVAENENVKIERNEKENDAENVKINKIEDEKQIAQRQSTSEFFSRKLEKPPEIKANTFTYLPENENDEDIGEKKCRWWIWFLIVLLLAGGTAGYFFWQPQLFGKIKNFSVNLFDKTTKLFEKEQANNNDSIEAIAPIIVPDTLQTDTLPTDSVSIFEQPRNYIEFITQETVDHGITLVQLSEKYYNSKAFWVYIYEANKNVIEHPDILKKGQIIKIPKLDEKLINASDSSCLNYAKELRNQYVKQ
ncbi:MAG: HU family DNA-binding protein [Prevotellaceae bacterium]|jgi:nucleoid-associated protein YgaU|nr:HU family DNA-binding protein [Prevotellaceae bacterium]